MLLTFRIQIANVKSPPVWRQLIVPANFSFAKFHLIIQAAFGWTDSHLFLFSPEGFASSPWIKVPDEEDENADVRVLNASRTKLIDIFPANQKYTYIYDFGDDWIHKIKLERIAEGDQKHAELIAGKGACPPEDCGGPWEYERLKQILKNPQNPEYEEMKEWLSMESDKVWDAQAFNLEEAKEAVKSI